MLGLLRDRLETQAVRSLAALALLAHATACGSGPHAPPAHAIAAGGPTSRIEERALDERPPLSIIEREGDPETAIAWASLAAGSPALHATWGELLRQRLQRAGFEADLVTHGLGFEVMLLAETEARSRTAVAALLKALTTPVSSAELRAAPRAAPEAAPSAVALCSAELGSTGQFGDASEIEQERVASFARDRSALGCVGTAEAAAAVAEALAAGPDWPELGTVRSILPEQSVTQIQRAERAALSVGVTVSDHDRALGAASALGDPKHALGVRLSAIGGGLRLRRVVATAHPRGACLRIDSDVDASPLPEARRLGFAVALMQEEARAELARGSDVNRLESTAISAADPRTAARAAAYRALTEPASDGATAELVVLSTPDGAISPAALDAATAQAHGSAPELEVATRVEAGQPGVWALVASPCAAATERAEAGFAAVLLGAASASPTRGARLEPWLGASGVGLLGFVERAPGESNAHAAARLGDALGHALLAPPSAVDVASSRAELLKTAGGEPRPLFEGLLDALTGGRLGALAPRGTVDSLLAASREAVLARQRDLLRLPHRVSVLSPSTAADAALVGKRLGRWLRTPDAARPSPCEGEVPGPARSGIHLAPGAETAEGSYVAFRIPGKSAAEAAVIVDLLNQSNSALAKALAEPELVGAARASLLGTASARALVVQLSPFQGRDAEAISRVERLFERISSGSALTTAALESALARQRTAHRLAALDPRYRLVQLLDPTQGPADLAALRRLLPSLRPEAAIVARAAPPSAGKTPASR